MADPSTISLVQGGLVLACSLVWSDTIKIAVSYIYPNNAEKVLQAQIVYAVVLTIIVILIIYSLKKTQSQIAKLENVITNQLEQIQKNKYIKNSYS